MGKQETKTNPDFPKALYGCQERGCAEEVSHFPEDLWLISDPPNGWDPGWYCDECIGEVRFHNPDTRIGETLEYYLGLERNSLQALNAELLEALKAVLPTLTNTVGGKATTQHKMAGKAIAKAEGKD